MLSSVVLSFIYWTDHLAAGTNWGTDVATGTDYTLVSGVDVSALTGGTDDYTVTAGELELAYDKFADTENLISTSYWVVQVQLLLTQLLDMTLM